jgi:hypothetical protein
MPEIKDQQRGPVSRTELDAMGCGTPGCTHDHSTLYLTPGCHPGSGTFVHYLKEHGYIIVECAECEKPVGAFWVGDGPRKGETN